MPRWLLALLASLGPGCTFYLSFAEDPEADASPDAGAVPDVLPRPPDAAADAAPDAAPDAGPRYLIFDDLTTWDAARAACEALGPTAHLLTITSAEENALVAPLLGLAHRWVG